MLKIKCLELFEGRREQEKQQEKNACFLQDTSLFHVVFSCNEHIYCKT